MVKHVVDVADANKLIDELSKDSKNYDIKMVDHYGQLKVIWKKEDKDPYRPYFYR